MVLHKIICLPKVATYLGIRELCVSSDGTGDLENSPGGLFIYEIFLHIIGR